MKYHGKRRQEPETTAVKESKVRGPLLQTYFTSLMSLVLCVGMFFGTSYAWFTSEVNNTANEIYIGTLDVGLYKKGASGWEDLSQSGVKLLNKDIRWEPGYTNLETIQVRNEGDLAFKYVLRFTDGSIVENGTQSAAVETQGQETAAQSTPDLNKIAENFVVWVYKHPADSNYQPPQDYDALSKEGSGWVKIGTLDEVLAGKAVLSGTMEKQPAASQSEATAANGTAAEEIGDTYTIALHMSKSADADVMKHIISLNVKLVAYQQTTETDSFGNSNYDKAVTDLAGLQDALSGGKEANVLLTDYIKIEGLGDALTMNGGKLDGGSNVVTYSGERNASGGSVGVLTVGGGEISNLTIAGGENGRALYVTELTSDLIVKNCTLSGAYSFNLNSAKVTDYTINFTNTKFANWTSYGNVAKYVYFTNCTFDDVLKPYGDATINNCTFTKEGLDVSALAQGEVITLINCTYNGVSVTNATIKNVNGTISVEGSDVVDLDTNGVLVLAPTTP